MDNIVIATCESRIAAWPARPGTRLKLAACSPCGTNDPTREAAR